MKCYFCHANLVPRDKNLPSVCECLKCATLHNLNSVFTCGDDNEEPLYAHIYLRPNADNQLYHVRLELKNEITSILTFEWYKEEKSETSGKLVFVISGFPITTDNANQKVPLYVLFS